MEVGVAIISCPAQLAITLRTLGYFEKFNGLLGL